MCFYVFLCISSFNFFVYFAGDSQTKKSAKLKKKPNKLKLKLRKKSKKKKNKKAYCPPVRFPPVKEMKSLTKQLKLNYPIKDPVHGFKYMIRYFGPSCHGYNCSDVLISQLFTLTMPNMWTYYYWNDEWLRVGGWGYRDFCKANKKKDNNNNNNNNNNKDRDKIEVKRANDALHNHNLVIDSDIIKEFVFNDKKQTRFMGISESMFHIPLPWFDWSVLHSAPTQLFPLGFTFIHKLQVVQTNISYKQFTKEINQIHRNILLKILNKDKPINQIVICKRTYLFSTAQQLPQYIHNSKLFEQQLLYDSWTIKEKVFLSDEVAIFSKSKINSILSRFKQCYAEWYETHKNSLHKYDGLTLKKAQKYESWREAELYCILTRFSSCINNLWRPVKNESFNTTNYHFFFIEPGIMAFDISVHG